MLAHPQSSSASQNLSFFPPPGPVESTETTSTFRPTDLPISEGPGLAHDAGNLLGALSLYCDLFESPGVLSPAHRHYAAELRLIYERSGALLSRLLHLTPATPAPVAPAAPAPLPPVYPTPATGRSAPAHQSPADTLHTLAPLLANMAAPYAQVTVEVAPRLPHIDLSAEALERIAVNLVRNAAQAIHASRLSGGHIHVSLSIVAGRLRLSVEDNGPGMPPALAAAFLHPSPLPPGADRGYGHRNIHELTQATGGRLGIHVRPGRGTTLGIDWAIPGGLHPNPPHHHTNRFQHSSIHLSPPSPIAALRLRPARSFSSHPRPGDDSA